MHQAPEASQGQGGELVVCQVPRTVDGQGYWWPVGRLGGRAVLRVWPARLGWKQEGRSKGQRSAWEKESIKCWGRQMVKGR